jgi:NAD(P)H-dependent flavin oxidoreductase YrpB (nitropropane dioxygenase family)
MSQLWLRRIGLRQPVVQAGMGGGLSGAALVAAVSEAGGLGTLGLGPPAEFRAELKLLRERLGERPFAANLLLPFVRAAHVAACLEYRPAVVTLFYGYDAALVRRLRERGIQVWQQVGDAAQAQRALDDGADGLIAQGVEAGGHLAGDTPLAELLPALRPLAGQRPLLAAGGIHDAATASRARQLGADGVVAGTRFLLTPESNASDEYKARLLAAQETLRTELFGLAWPAPHRVVPNAATARWCGQDARGPAWARALNTLMVPSRRLLPMSAVVGLVGMQRLMLPLYSPAAPLRGMPAHRLEVAPLYAGTCVARIDRLLPAAEIVAELARGYGAA